ncbi:hypothetical protein [Paraburkholderia megapolitana]|uniref:hypothetical protein n=1 Tax=Paraburkholderia megapolitana TaxID=420953 RepID=UPI0038B9668F
MRANFFARFLAEAFPGRSLPERDAAVPGNVREQSPEVACGSTIDSKAEARTVGQGAGNEVIVSIDGIPQLFVDEGDCVEQFSPAFDESPQETPFGIKILPDHQPYWKQTRTHRCPMKDAIAGAIRGTVEVPRVITSAGPSVAEASGTPKTGEVARTPVPQTRQAPARSEVGLLSVTGTIASWGEEKFPRRKGTGSRFYTSFAMRIETATGEQILQGEGLKDAITQSGCQVGDAVTVHRTGKTQVPAVHTDGSPKLVDGKPVMWDKWLWSITL